MKGALGRRAVAEERHRHAPVRPELCGRGRTNGDGQASSHDAVGAEDPELRVGDVHGAAAAAVGSPVLAHQLGEHAQRVEAFGQAVAVATVGGGDGVRRMQRPARTDRRRLLPDREVDEPGDLTVAVERGHPLLEPTDQHHPPVHLEEIGRRERRRRRRVGGHGLCSIPVGRYNKGSAMIGQIEIPESFPSPGVVSGKRVVITGASRGLGSLLAHAFSDAGASVVLVARTERDLKSVAARLPGPSLVLSGDVTDEDFNEAVADTTIAEWGGVDAWLCNAGISPIVAGPRQTEAPVWRQILEVNLTGAFLGARAAARVMTEGGRLIFTGSVLGERPRKGLTAYSASKAGLVGMAKGLALDLAPLGVTVNVVAPGWFDSPLADPWKNSPEHSATITGHTALGGAGEHRWSWPAPISFWSRMPPHS